MSALDLSYEKFFETAFGAPPFDYQRRLAEDTPMPSLVNVPTGAGKTAAVLGAWLWRRLMDASSVGRRLIYCLPMRTLVEQTDKVANAAIESLERSGLIEAKRFKPYVLMGGDVDEGWEWRPESECILIGTQDMLLSRALNRGYAMSRYRWPVHFGLLNNDCLWVLDEIQLMGDGLATSTQLAAFREVFNSFGSCESIWMSATLDPEWLKTIDFAPHVHSKTKLELSDADRAIPVLGNRLTAAKRVDRAPDTCRLPEGLALFAKERHAHGTQTLIVVNRVARARETFDALRALYYPVTPKRKKGEAALEAAPIAPEIKLIHSRFRPHERKEWMQMMSAEPTDAGRIIVATQVVEAGVDISSQLLITDIAPYASLVQRFGRCNRFGEFDEARVFWIDRPLDEKDEKVAEKSGLDDKEKDKVARPYKSNDVQTARAILTNIESASPSNLPDHHDPYQPSFVLRRRDLVDLFDTTPDLSGYDLDVSRFVRAVDERDVAVAWRELNGGKPEKSEPRPMRDELCPVALHELGEFIKGKEKIAWVWDALDGDWRELRGGELRAGLRVVLDATAGGYDQERGWDARSKNAVAAVPTRGAENEAYQDDPLTWQKYEQTLAAHSIEARQAANCILVDLALSELNKFSDELLSATQHHDWGKAHPVFQATLHKVGRENDLDGITFDPLLAKSKSGQPHRRRLFRHELASALALLQTGASDLTVYLAACHHGKVRLSIRALPGEDKPRAKDNEGKHVEAKFARGIWDGDELLAADLGNDLLKERVVLDLEPMLLGAGEDGSRSWLERTIALRDELGVFRLAFLEALIRAADVRASMFPKDTLPVEDEAK